MSVLVGSRINGFADENKVHRKSESDSGIGTPEDGEMIGPSGYRKSSLLGCSVDMQCTQSPWTYGYPMNSPLVKTAKTDGSQQAFVFEFPLSKERDSFLPSNASFPSLTRMMSGLSVGSGSHCAQQETVGSNSDGEQDAESCSTTDSDSSSHQEWDKQWAASQQGGGQQRSTPKLVKRASEPNLDATSSLYNSPIRKTSSFPPAGFRNRSFSTNYNVLYEIPLANQQTGPAMPDFTRAAPSPATLDNGLAGFPTYCPPQQARYSPSNQISSTDFVCTWSGQLPPRQHRNPTYSTRIFVGGVPWDITEAGLLQAFRPFGNLNIEWPGKEAKHCRHPPKGYVYITFESERSIKALLMSCTHDPSNGGQWYYQVSSKRMRNKEVQIIPWALCDGNSIRCPSPKLDPSRTVFVGGLHGLINADALAHIMDDLFGGVVYAGIDTDKYKYPIGSGRVTFGNQKSFMKAVQAGFIEIKTTKFTKKVQVDPYLEDSLCSVCNRIVGPYFCRDLNCFKYYCRSCWQWQHGADGFTHHRPLTRTTKSARPL